MDKQVVTKQRIAKHGEVLTGRREIKAMLDLLKSGRIDSRFRLGPMRTVSVFLRDNDEWRLLAQSLTPCEPIAIQAGRC